MSRGFIFFLATFAGPLSERHQRATTGLAIVAATIPFEMYR